MGFCLIIKSSLVGKRGETEGERERERGREREREGGRERERERERENTDTMSATLLSAVGHRSSAWYHVSEGLCC